MTVYEGEPGWGGPIQVRTQGGRPVEAHCLACGARWPITELAADKLSRVLGPASCPNGCEAILHPGERYAGFRDQGGEPHLG
jgi:hypothetical protein